VALPTLLCKRKVAAALDVSVRTVDRLRAAGEIESLRVEGQVRILEESLERYIERQLGQIEATAEPADEFPIPARDASRRKAA
jgi:excisionase family DNA binding protein